MNKLKQVLKQKDGLSLVETLTALTLLALIIFCFTPLFNIYFRSINIAGHKTNEVYQQSGLEQKFISDAGLSANHAHSLSSCGISLVGKDGVIYAGPDVSGALVTTAGVIKKDALGQPIQKKDEYGNPIPGVYELVGSAGAFTTIKANGVTSNITCFPSTITDDFKQKNIVLVNRGLNPAEIELFVSVAGDDGKSVKEVALTKGKDYKFTGTPGVDLFKTGSNETVNIITLYGGSGLISYENSPLIVKTAGFEKKIEIDAPAMMMVGESGAENKFYVASGEIELDDKGKESLVVIQREMNSKDPKLGRVTLNSVMNDIEWVEPEDGDGRNTFDVKDKSGKVIGTEKYGYYVMCGENGQIRRFWKNPNTGNYYWGGDWTQQTDMHLDRVDNQKYITAVPAYDTTVSYKFFVRRDPMKKQGYVLGGFKGKNSIESYNTWSVTALDDKAPAYIYAPVGKLFHYQLTGSQSETSIKVPSYDNIKDINNLNSNKYGKLTATTTGGLMVNKDAYYSNIIQNRNEAMAWIKPTVGGYSLASGRTAASPISLTCVDAITLQATSNKSYQGDANLQNNNHLFRSDGEAIALNENTKYPTESYTLYCGSIPAFMDVFADSAINGGGSWQYPDNGWAYPSEYYNGSIVRNHTPNNLNYTSDIINDRFSFLRQAKSSSQMSGEFDGSRLNEASLYSRWKGNYGVTPYIDNQVGSTGNGVTVGEGIRLGSRWFKQWKETDYVDYYPYKNIQYAITGKLADGGVTAEALSKHLPGVVTSGSMMPGKTYNTTGYRYNNGDSLSENKQSNLTGGDVVDITVSYYSQPFIVEAGANPTDDVVFDLSNDKQDRTFYWNNRRETVTMLDCASTRVPIIGGDKANPTYEEISVSLMVGYTMGGTVQYIGDYNIPFINSVMNNGIVYIRAGDAEYGQQWSDNSHTGEYYAKDKDGYLLNKESNTFHQFYYLNNQTTSKTDKNSIPMWNGPGYAYKHIGNLFGAHYWQDNRHIGCISMNGGEAVHENADNVLGNYNYVRSHPMTNTKVLCVNWGQTWEGNPEAMWGTENGTVLSWDCDLQAKDKTSKEHGGDSVCAELQSYKWVDQVDGETYSVKGYTWNVIGKEYDYNWHYDTVGSAKPNSGSRVGHMFNKFNLSSYIEFYDRGSREYSIKNKLNTEEVVGKIGVISTLSSTNDVCFADDMWVAVGNQGCEYGDGFIPGIIQGEWKYKQPADYCGIAGAGMEIKGADGKTEKIMPYTDDGKGGSWVYVRYLFKGGTTNNVDASYLWKAVKISNKPGYNIVQINNVNGMWIATGYEDSNHNNECDEDEKTVVCWTYDPLKSCNDNGWSENTKFWEYDDNEFSEIDPYEVGGINSVATR